MPAKHRESSSAESLDWVQVAQMSPSGLALYTNLPRTPTSNPYSVEDSRWIHAAHVDLVDQILVDLYAGVYRELGYVGVIVEEPPRHGKSELCSHYNPAWFIGTKPDERVILVSYEATFAASWGRKARDTLDEFGRQVFGVEINKRSSAADRWDIKGHRGGMYTAGILGGITGKGANALVLDDVVKNKTEANSEIIRNRVWDEYKNTFRTRLEPDGVIFVIGTRWHEDDLIGRLLASQGDSREGKNHPLYEEEGDRFIRVRLPAICEGITEDYPHPDPLGREEGEELFPQRWPKSKLRPMMNTDTWDSLYQQRPAPKEGGAFNPGNFELVPHPGGKWKKVVRRWDLAATEEKPDTDPDYTVGLLYAEHPNGLYYVLDIVRGRFGPNDVEKVLRQTKDEDRRKFGRQIKFTVEREPGSQGKLYARHLARTIFRGCNFRAIPSTGSKMLRADTVAAATERQEVKIVKGCRNYKELLHEARHFPYGAHDDVIDALSGAHEDVTARGGKVTTW